MVTLTTTGPIKCKLLCSLSFSVVCLALAAVYMTVDVVQVITTYRMRVSENSIVKDFLSIDIETFHISTYLFNITNAERFMAGEDPKLEVKEVGPFTYKEIRINDDLDIDVEAGVIRYSPRSVIEFVPEESVGNPDDVIITAPNLPMLGLTSTVSTFNYFTRIGWNMLVAQLNTQPIISISATDYLWGYKDPLLTLAHAAIPGLLHFDKIGILDRLFDKKIPNHLEVSAREEDKFTIKTRNGITKLPMGNFVSPEACETCDEFINTYEGMGYPSPITPETPITLYRTGVCKLLPMVFHKKVILENNVEGLVFNLSDSFYSFDPNVTKNRMLDLQACFYELPVVLTKVHFLDMDPKVYERLDGIKPDPTKNCYIIIEPKIATQVKSYFPVQLNLRMRDLSYNTAASPFSNMVLPIGYVEINQAPSSKMTKDALYLMYVISPILLLLAKIAFPILALASLGYAILLLSKKKTMFLKLPVVLSTQIPLLNSLQRKETTVRTDNEKFYNS